MEENKKKPSYEELEQKASEVFMANQKMQQFIERAQERIAQLESALSDRDFNVTSFFLSMLFKVVEHPEMFKQDFVEWCASNIQGALISFYEERVKEAEQEASEEKGKEAGNEA